MHRIAFSFLLGAIVLLMNSFSGIVHAEWEGRGYAPEGVMIGEQSAGIAGQSGVGLTDYDLRARTLDRYQDAKAARYDSRYGPYSRAYGYNYPAYSSYPAYPAYQTSYSTYPAYQTAYPGYGYGYRAYPGYGAYYYNPGMYNPSTTFVNPPSSLNASYGYPSYSETYIRRRY